MVLSVIAGSFLALGFWLIVAGARRAPRPQSTASSTPMWTKWIEMWKTMERRHRHWALICLLAGVGVAVWSGWLLAAVLIPLFGISIPMLLTAPPQREIDVLAGLDRWVRLLTPSIAIGKSIRDAIVATRKQAPSTIAPSVTRLTTRLEQGWETRTALLAMADELKMSDSDAVLAALAICSTRGGRGARVTLSALSDTIQHRLRVLREISAERAKPRAVVRQVTTITLVVLGAAIAMGGTFFDPYRSPVGQVIAIVLAASYVGCLAILRRRTNPTPAARFLRSQT